MIFLASASPEVGAHSVEMCPGWIVRVLELVQTVGDIAGMTAMCIGLVIGIGLWIKGEITNFTSKAKGDRWHRIRTARLFIGNYILLGLELMIVSDIIHSFLKPNIESLYELGLIVVIRTAISFFLGKELETVHREEHEPATP